MNRLERDCDKAPTPGQFHAAYRAALARAKSIDDAPAVCELCDGTGWVQADDLIEQIAGEPHPYSQVDPMPVQHRRTDASRPRIDPRAQPTVNDSDDDDEAIVSEAEKIVRIARVLAIVVLMAGCAASSAPTSTTEPPPRWCPHTDPDSGQRYYTTDCE